MVRKLIKGHGINNEAMEMGRVQSFKALLTVIVLGLSSKKMAVMLSREGHEQVNSCLNPSLATYYLCDLSKLLSPLGC